MKTIAILLFLCSSAVCFSQSSVSQDTLRNQLDEISISYTVTADLDSITEVTIHQFDIIGPDTISIFIGTYNLEEDTPSSFQTFSMNETTGELNFGIGEFEYGQFYSKIVVGRIVGLPEEFIFN